MSTDETRHSKAERITFSISVLILAVILGLATWSHFEAGTAPPTIEVQADLSEMREEGSAYYVPVSITNTGGLTAESVTVRGEIAIEGEEPETAEVTIDFLAGGESENAELVFTTDPNDGDFTVNPVSFLYP